jgi:hypothetical protein
MIPVRECTGGVAYLLNDHLEGKRDRRPEHVRGAAKCFIREKCDVQDA